jgi:hypothetical protein
MAVGSTSTNGAIAERWSGTTWTMTALPVLTDSVLYAVSCPMATLCVAAGQYTPATANQALVLFWNSVDWALGTAADQGTGSNVLRAISCPNNSYCMAGGYYLSSVTGLEEPLAEWNAMGITAAAWNLASPAINAPGANNSLSGISCAEATLCMAVGDTDLLSQDRNLSFTWNGTTWSRRSVVEPGSAVDRLEAVRCPALASATTFRCVAVGEESSDSSTTYETAILAWNGTSWTQRPSPSAQPYQNLDGLGCSSATSCVAVGDESDSHNDVALADSFNGRIWTRDSAKIPVALTQFLDGASCTSASFCMVVGEYENGYEDPTLAQVWNGRKWTALSTQQLGSDSSLAAVSCVSRSWCVAVGYESFGEVLLDTSGSRGGPGQTGPGIPQSGEEGLIELWTGGRWTATTVGLATGSEILTGVSCVSANFCAAVGDSEFQNELESYIWHGKSWTRAVMPSLSGDGESPSSVSCTSATSCVAVGTAADDRRAFAEHWNGRRWSVMSLANPPKPYDTLNGVDCPSAERCIAVGGDWANVNDFIPQDNLAESWNGTKWSLSPAPTSVYSVGGLAAVSCNSAFSCLAAGPGDTQLSQRGIVLRLFNGHWSSVTLPAGALAEVDLQGVSETSAGSAVVVGTKRDSYGFSGFTLVESGGHWAVK